MKTLFNNFLIFYYRINKLNTGYILPNKLFVLLIIIISTSSLLIRNNFLEYYKENPYIFYTILSSGIFSIIYMVFNLLFID